MIRKNPAIDKISQDITIHFKTCHLLNLMTFKINETKSIRNYLTDFFLQKYIFNVPCNIHNKSILAVTLLRKNDQS